MHNKKNAPAKALMLFDRYVEMPHAELSRALSELQQENADVCLELMRLLAADEQTHSFASPLQWFAGQSGSAQNDSAPQAIDRIWPDGTRLGPWCVDGIIGIGGMGVIYAAHRADGLYEREIALKTIRTEIMSPTLQQAFAKERNHLAKLEHPSIVAFYDAGIVEDGQPWLAMARVHGDAIDVWCDMRRKSLHDRVRLLLDACDAISYAHAHGVLHQDIKPSNLLVTDDGKVRLLDFGLSAMLTLHDDSGFIRVGVSSAYAAPEIFEGAPPSVAIDVYALGVVLYQLLCDSWPREPRMLTTLSRPHSEVARNPSRLAEDVAMDVALARGARDPQALSRQLRGDLDAIARRCVRLDPVERYASFSDLRADLHAWLHHRPVIAREGGWMYRATRFVRRNAVAVPVTTMLAIALTGGGLVAVQQQQRARMEVENSGILSQLFEKSLGDATLNSLGSAPLSSKAMLEDTERRLRAAAGDDRPQLLARGLAALAHSYLVRVDFQSAERLLTESKRLGVGDPLQMARTDAVLAKMLNDRGKPVDAERLVKEGLAMIPARDGMEDELARIDLEVQHVHARLKQGDPSGAFTIIDREIMSAKALGKDAWPTLAVLLRLRSVMNDAKGRSDDVEKDLRSALAITDDRRLAIRNAVRQALALHLAKKGLREESHRLAAESLLSSVKVFGPTHAETGEAWLTIAQTWYLCMSDPRRAKVALEQSDVILTKELGPYNSSLERVNSMRASLAMATEIAKQEKDQDWTETLAYARRAVDIAERVNGPDFARTYALKDNLALALIGKAATENGKESDALYREADSILSDIIIEGERRGLDMAHAHANRVGPLLSLERIDDAEREAQFGIDNAMANGGERGLPMNHAARRMVQVRLAQGRYDEAAALLVSRHTYLPPIEDSPYDHFNAQGMLLYVEIERGDLKRIRSQYMKVRRIAERYGFMDELNAEEVPGITPVATKTH